MSLCGTATQKLVTAKKYRLLKVVYTFHLQGCGIHVYIEGAQDCVKRYQISRFVLLKSDETNGKKI